MLSLLAFTCRRRVAAAFLLPEMTGTVSPRLVSNVNQCLLTGQLLQLVVSRAGLRPARFDVSTVVTAAAFALGTRVVCRPLTGLSPAARLTVAAEAVGGSSVRVEGVGGQGVAEAVGRLHAEPFGLILPMRASAAGRAEILSDCVISRAGFLGEVVTNRSRGPNVTHRSTAIHTGSHVPIVTTVRTKCSPCETFLRWRVTVFIA